jgi:hypothetical protein
VELLEMIARSAAGLARQGMQDDALAQHRAVAATSRRANQRRLDIADVLI